MSHISIILGSTRPGRFGDKPAQWIYEIAKQQQGATFALIDLQEIGLPLLDEPVPPAADQYSQPHTKQWAEKVAASDGFIFVTGEYNHGIPASLKNAIDFVYKEWHHKPAAFVGYGAEAGGARAIEQLRQVLGWVKVYDLSSHVIIPNYWNDIDEIKGWVPPAGLADDADRVIKDIVFWADELKASRAKLV